MAGWIRLHRTMLYHGHLNMPSKTLKLWIFFLLKAAPWAESQKELEVGELWTSYQEIKEGLSENNKKMSEHTISKALSYLQQHGYIDLEIRNFYGIKVKILNWSKYQNTGRQSYLPSSENASSKNAEKKAIKSAAESAIESAGAAPQKPGDNAALGPPKNNKNLKNNPPEVENTVKTLITAWQNRFYKKFGTRPQTNLRGDYTLFREMLRHREPGELIELLGLFFSSEDPWIKGSGYTVRAFKSQLNKLLAQREQAKSCYRGNEEYMARLAKEYL